MLDVTIYEKDGKRHLYDHVCQITNIEDNVVLDFLLDFDGRGVKIFDKKNVAYMTVRIMP